jgi:hypothetical protein
MFKNSDNDNDTKIGHTRSGRIFREVRLVNLFERDQEPLLQEEGFYSGEEEELLIEEQSGSVGPREEKTEEPHREELETLGTGQIVEVSTVTPPVVSTTLSNQSKLSYQSTQSTGIRSLVPIQSRNLGRSMADEMRLPTFKGDGSEDPEQH